MDLLEKLRFIVKYYRSTRAVGHTETMLRGVQNVNRVAVLVPTRRMAEVLVRNPEAKLISWLTLESLQGMNLPLILDHSTVEVLCKDAIEEIEGLKKENQELREKLEKEL